MATSTACFLLVAAGTVRHMRRRKRATSNAKVRFLAAGRGRNAGHALRSHRCASSKAQQQQHTQGPEYPRRVSLSGANHVVSLDICSVTSRYAAPGTVGKGSADFAAVEPDCRLGVVSTPAALYKTKFLNHGRARPTRSAGRTPLQRMMFLHRPAIIFCQFFAIDPDRP